MPREYRNIKEYEREIFALREQGKTNREVCEKFGLKQRQLENFINRHNRNQAKLSSGKLIKPNLSPNCCNVNSVNRIIKRMAAAVDLPPCRVHDFRHSFASILFEKDISLKDVSQLLGHGQTSTTERIYVHKKRVGNIESINAIANVIGF